MRQDGMWLLRVRIRLFTVSIGVLAPSLPAAPGQRGGGAAGRPGLRMRRSRFLFQASTRPNL